MEDQPTAPGDPAEPLRQAALEQDDERGQTQRKDDVEGNTNRKRLKDRGGISNDGDEQTPRERKPGHWGNPSLMNGADGY